MRRLTARTIGMGALTLILCAGLVGCEPKGPAEKAGESLDKAGSNLKDAVTPQGPAEKAGDKIDKALGDK